MRFKEVSTLVLCFMLMTNTTSYAIPSTSINKSIEVYKGQVNLPNKEWTEKIEYIVGKDNIPFNYDNTYYYEDENYSGTLNAKKVTITPKQKIENREEITVYREFQKSQSGVHKNNYDGNFSNSYLINEDGYYGFINRTNVEWTPNWVRGQTVYHSQLHTTGWLMGNPPNTINTNYYHSESNTTINTNLNLVGINNTEVGNSYKYSESSGQRYNYSRDNEKLGYMSQNNKTYYWKKTYNYADPKPLEPNDYWGSEPDKDNWQVVDWAWDEDKAYSADELSSIPIINQHLTYSNGSWWWKSLSGTLNKYRKGVWIKYRKQIPVYRYTSTYGGNIAIPDYIRDYNGKANYIGTLSKKEEKITYTCDYWDVNILYEGNANLKDVQVSGQVIPTPSQKGGKITFNLNTRYYPNKLEIFIPSELQSKFGQSVITLNIEEKIYLSTNHSVILDLYIDETLDKEDNRLKEPYKFKVRATRSDGKYAETILNLDIKGTIFDNIKSLYEIHIS